MEILSVSWGGKDEHGELSVDARMDGSSLIITAIDTEFDANHTKKQREFIKDYTTQSGLFDKAFLFRCIRDLLLENNATNYMFTEDDIRF